MTPTNIASQAPELPPLPEPAVPSEPIMKADSNRSADRGDYYQDGATPDYYTADQLHAYALADRAGRASQAVAPGWQPIETAPEGVRVLLGPRSAPVVGTVSHPVPWQDGETFCCVVHYNDNVLVAGYHCSEWMPLPAPPSAVAQQAETNEASDEVELIAKHIEENWKLAERDPRDIAKDIRTLIRYYRSVK